MDHEIIKSAFQFQFRCDTHPMEPVAVKVGFMNHIFYDGNVSVVRLHGHPFSDVGYAWEMGSPDDVRLFTAIQYGPVKNALDAVSAAVALGWPHQSSAEGES